MTQNQILLKHLQRTGRITQREAIMDHSIQALCRRIKDLREMGHDIVTRMKKHPITGQRYGEFVYRAPKPTTYKPSRQNVFMQSKELVYG